MWDGEEHIERGERTTIIVATVAAHLATLAYLIIARFMIDQGTPPGADGIFAALVNWDALHYVRIALLGYVEDFYLVFFPLYPHLIFYVSFVFQDILLSALVLNFFCHIGASLFLYRLVRLDYSKDIAFYALLSFLLYPAAFITVVPYTESLFLFLLFAAVYQYRVQQFKSAAALALLCASCRITGAFFIVFVLIEWLLDGLKWQTIKRTIPCMLAPVLGVVLYLFLNYDVSGDPLRFMQIQALHFHRQLTLPDQGFWQVWAKMQGAWPENFTVGYANLIGALVAWLVAVIALFKLRLSYGMFCLALAMLFTFQSWWQSLIRYDMALFPLFIFCGILCCSVFARYTLLSTFLALQALFALQYARGWWSV